MADKIQGPKDIIDNFKNYLLAYSEHGKMLLHYDEDANIRVGIMISGFGRKTYNAIICYLTDEGYWYYDDLSLYSKENNLSLYSKENDLSLYTGDKDIDGIPITEEDIPKKIFLFKDMKSTIYVEDILVDGPLLCTSFIEPSENESKFYDFVALSDKTFPNDVLFHRYFSRDTEQSCGFIDIVGCNSKFDTHRYKEGVCIRIISIYLRNYDLNVNFGLMSRINVKIAFYSGNFSTKIVDIPKTGRIRKSLSKEGVRGYRKLATIKKYGINIQPPNLEFEDIQRIFYGYYFNMKFFHHKCITFKSINNIISLLKLAYLQLLEQHYQYYRIKIPVITEESYRRNKLRRAILRELLA